MHNLLAEEDFDALRDMVSAKLLAAMQATAQDYHAAGIIWRTELDPSEPIQARISGTSLWTRSQIAEYDEDRAGVEDPPGAESYGPFGKWLVVSVQFKTTQRLVIEREGNGGVVARLTDRRPTTWKFASGPLPEKLPVAQLDTPWWLLNLG